VLLTLSVALWNMHTACACLFTMECIGFTTATEQHFMGMTSNAWACHPCCAEGVTGLNAYGVLRQHLTCKP
jgi:hypothetical protein